MTKSKSFWAAAALSCLAVMGFSAYSIYGRVALHFSGDTLEVRPVPMPPPAEEEAAPAKAEEAAEEAQPEAKAAPAEDEPARIKAIKTVFEYRDTKARSVQIAGSFTSWKARPMTRKNGVWKAEVYILPGTYPYHFNVDGRKKLDPAKPKAPTGDSLVTVE